MAVVSPQTLQSQQAMSDAMKGATKAMMVMNRRMNIPAMQKILQNFEMQSEMMDMKEEMMADAMDDIFDEDQEEEETDEILNQVLDEIGINLSSEVPALTLTLSSSRAASPLLLQC